MFGIKERHKEIVEAIMSNEKACEELSREVYDIKELLTELELDSLIKNMEEFIRSASYLSEVLKDAEITSYEITDSMEIK